jgi:hypothetical protein
MTNPNSNLVIAAAAGGGTTGAELLWVAPTGTTLPTNTTTALTTVSTSWNGMGYVSTDGVTLGQDESWEEIEAFGAASIVRKVNKGVKHTFNVEWMEHKLDVLEVVNRLDLGTIAPSATGAFTIRRGVVGVQRYSFVIDIVDDTNHIRHVVPNAEVTDVKEQKVTAGAAITHAGEITCYPDASNISIYSYYLIPALASS